MAALPVNLGYNVAVWHHIGDKRVQLARGDAVLGAASDSVGVSGAIWRLPDDPRSQAHTWSL